MNMKVMVAIDESDGSFYALNWFLDNLFTTMASTGGGIPDENSGMVFLVHVQPKFHHFVYPVGPGGAGYSRVLPNLFTEDLFTLPNASRAHKSHSFYPASTVVDSVEKAQEQRSAAILSRALQMCKDRLVKAETIILKGEPREMICQAAEQMQVNILIMGSRGLGSLKRAFLGSVSDYCAHHAKIPILIVKPPEEHSKKR